MTTKHRDVDDIKMYLESTQYEENKKQRIFTRRKIGRMLIKKSNSVYNNKIVNKELMGNVIPVKKTKSEISKLSHVVCSGCGGLYSKKHVSEHMRRCTPTGKTRLVSSFLLPPYHERFEQLRNEVFTKMNKDHVSLVAQTDPLILEYGRRFHNNHKRVHQRNYVSNKIRTLAQLLVRMKLKDPQNVIEMTDCVDPSNFDTLCQVVREWSVLDVSSGMCDVGSVPRRLCKSLKMCSEVLKSLAIKDKSMTDQDKKIRVERCLFFESLMKRDWCDEINAASDKSLRAIKVAKEDKDPPEEDVSMFLHELTLKIRALTVELKSRPDSSHVFRELCRALIAFLIVFNGRRPGEIVQATVDNYRDTLRQGGRGLSVFNVAATKNDVKVPVILHEPAKTAIDTLLRCKPAASRETDNKLLFPNEHGSLYNGTEVLSKCVRELKLSRPTFFTANGLRHFWATKSQSDVDVKRHMPKFLGHTLKVHRQYYELPSSDIHLNVIGPKLLEYCPTGYEKCHTVTSSDTTSIIDTDASVSGGVVDVQSTPASDIHLNAIGPKLLEYRPKEYSSSHTVTDTASTRIDTDKEHKAATSVYDVVNVQSTPTRTEEEWNFDHNSTPDRSTGSGVETGVVTPEKVVFSPPRRTTRRSLQPESCKVTTNNDDSSPGTPTGRRQQTTDPDWQCTPDRSSSDGGSTTFEFKPRNRWTTPEREELFQAIPHTILGQRHPGRGTLKRIWLNSKIIRKRHSLQMTRIEVSKYYTGKKKMSSPVKRGIMRLIDTSKTETAAAAESGGPDCTAASGHHEGESKESN